MVNLTAKYLGLTLKSPLIVSSSGLTHSTEKIARLAEYGAGAVVLKSLFEEQINFEAGSLLEDSLSPEAHDYILGYTKSNALEEYLQLIEQTRKQVKIPIIASINCMNVSEWIKFSKDIEGAGADALELNVFFIASDKEWSSEKYEALYYDLVVKIRKVTNLPLAVKIGCHYTNLVSFVHNLYVRGARAVVMFNRFYEPDIDIDHMKHTSAGVFSHPSDIRQSLRWVGIISDQVDRIDIAASTGIHDGRAVVKQILAGAHTVQLCSVLYKKGPEELKRIQEELKDWMIKKNYRTLNEFRGLLNYRKIQDPSVYERSQFMKYFSSYQ
jgi:dihydroorotate dehydrogenase (fumarate)